MSTKPERAITATQRVGAPRVVVVSHACVVDVNQEPFLALAQRGVAVHVIAPDQLRTDVRGIIPFRALPGIEATSLPVRIGGFRRGLRQAGVHLIVYQGLRKTIAALRPDVLYAEEEPWSLTTWQVARIAKKLGVPFVFHQSQNVDKRLPIPFERIRRRVLRRAAGATVRLEGPARILQRQGFDKPMLSIPNVIDPSRFEHARATYQGLERPVYGYVGRLVPEKGVIPFLRAAAEARRRNGSGSVLVVGDGPLAAAAHALATALEIPATFTGGVEHGAVGGVFASMDVLAVPSSETKSWKEQFGRVVIEANAAGVPVVATDCGALGDTVRATGGGVVVPQLDPDALAGALARLGIDRDERVRLSATGQAAVRERFTHDAVAAQLDVFFSTMKELR
ncbi:MAG: glycosyltransferase family 4 protein [Actinomycetota bacterium]